jgi:type VI secretion system secreted protein Hcp
MSMISGDLTRRDASTPAISEIPITHEFDDASINFFDLAVSGATGKLVKIDLCRTAVGQNAPEVYLHIELEETLVSGYNMGGAGGPDHQRPLESLSLNFSKITWTYTPLNPDNTPGTPITKGYDLKVAKPF